MRVFSSAVLHSVTLRVGACRWTSLDLKGLPDVPHLGYAGAGLTGQKAETDARTPHETQHDGTMEASDSSNNISGSSLCPARSSGKGT